MTMLLVPCYGQYVLTRQSSADKQPKQGATEVVKYLQYMHKDKEITQMEMLYGKEKTRDSFPH